jgi:hypothetical protein
MARGEKISLHAHACIGMALVSIRVNRLCEMGCGHQRPTHPYERSKPQSLETSNNHVPLLIFMLDPKRTLGTLSQMKFPNWYFGLKTKT